MRLQIEPLPGDVASLLLHVGKHEEPSAHIRQRLRERLVPLISPRGRSRTLAVLPWGGLQRLAAGALRSRTAIAFASFSIGAAASALRFSPAPPQAVGAAIAAPLPPAPTVPRQLPLTASSRPELRAPRPARAISVPKAVSLTRRLTSPPESRAASAVPVAKPTLQLEGELLEKGRIAMVRGDSDGALAAVEEHLARFRDGKLAEEREALRVQALVTSDRAPEARAALAAFRHAYPNSLVEPALEAAVAR